MSGRLRTPLVATVAKSLLAAAVFVTTVGAYSFFADDSRKPLPGGGIDPGGCTLWFIGSSSIHKWQRLGEDMAPWRAHNRGVNGAQLDQLRRRFARDDDPATPEAAIIYGGENDIAQGASATDVADQMIALVDEVRARGSHPPVFVVSMKPSPTRWRFRAEQQRYDALMRHALVPRAGVRFVAVGDTLLINGRPGPFYVDDGVHLNRAGYARWGGAIRRQVEAALPAAEVARCTKRPAR
jgi:lysophospholipase L1-like esterase